MSSICTDEEYIELAKEFLTFKKRIKKLEYFQQRNLYPIMCIGDFRGNTSESVLEFFNDFEIASYSGNWDDEDKVNLLKLKVKGPALRFFKDLIKERSKEKEEQLPDQIPLIVEVGPSGEISPDEIKSIREVIERLEEQFREQTDPIPLKLVKDFHGRLNGQEQSIFDFFFRFEAAAAVLNLNESWKLSMLAAKLKHNAHLYFQQYSNDGVVSYSEMKDRLIALYSEKVPYWIRETSIPNQTESSMSEQLGSKSK